MNLDYQKRLQLSEALQNAFDPDGFDRMLFQRVDKKRRDIVSDQTFPEIVFQVIEAAERGGWTAKLISEALEANPANPELLEFVRQNPEYDPDSPKADLPHASRKVLWRAKEIPWIGDYLDETAELAAGGSGQTEADSVIETQMQEGFVFFCYARADEEFCLKLARGLKDRGVDIWVDQWDIPGGANWDRSIDEALSKCDRLLIVLSPSSVNSNEVLAELQTALDDKKPIVPILYQKCAVPRRLRRTQHIDFESVPPDDQAKVDQLLQALRSRKKQAARAIIPTKSTPG